MVVFDATVFTIAIYDNAGVPNDYRTGKPVERAKERVARLIEDLERDGESILIPAPALAEALVCVAEHAERYVNAIEDHSCFQIQPFGTKEAIEIAIRTKDAIKAGDKKDGVQSPWQKVKYDRQIVATAKAQRATVIYTADRDIIQHAALWNVRAVHLADLPTRAGEQPKLYEALTPDLTESAPLPGGTTRSIEGQTGAEAHEIKADEKEAAQE